MSTQYIISRTLDPIFGVSVGLAAAAVRIRREETEKGRGTDDTIGSLRRRMDLAWNAAEAEVPKGVGEAKAEAKAVVGAREK